MIQQEHDAAGVGIFGILNEFLHQSFITYTNVLYAVLETDIQANKKLRCGAGRAFKILIMFALETQAS